MLVPASLEQAQSLNDNLFTKDQGLPFLLQSVIPFSIQHSIPLCLLKQEPFGEKIMEIYACVAKWEADISHMAFFSCCDATAQTVPSAPATHCATNLCENSHHWTVPMCNCIRFQNIRSNKEPIFSEGIGFPVIMNKCLDLQKFLFLFRNIVCFRFFLIWLLNG